MPDDSRLSSDDRALGMGRSITRRDFVNNTLVGTGGALLAASAPLALGACGPGGEPGAGAASTAGAPRPVSDDWSGYGAVGDYASSSGNTREVMEAAHRLRDGVYATLPPETVDTGELFDMVVVGGGMSGLGAAHFFTKNAGANQTCLVLENHPIFGGEAKQNEFIVDGQLLIGPQGSNDFGIPAEGSGSLADQVFTELRIPREFEYQDWAPGREPLAIALDNYAHMTGVAESRVDIGYFFEEPDGTGRRVNNMWREDLRSAPYPEAVKRDLLEWRYASGENTDEFRRMLDRITYREYIEDVLELSPEVTAYTEPVIGLINGATPDATSAFAASQIGMPGVGRGRGKDANLAPSFPGGNTAFARYMVKDLIPDAIDGAHGFADVMNGRVAFAALDRPGDRVRIRCGATVVHVEHDASSAGDRRVLVTYEKDGRPYRVAARGVVMASGGWVNQHVIRDLPAEVRSAYEHFHHVPALVVNVALTNWRFMYDLGITAAQWSGGDFGFSCNLRQPMLVGDYRPPLDPDRPTILTFYMGIYRRGLSVYEQGVAGRNELFATPFADYERRLRERMIRCFGDSGFDPERDIAGIILNRWGHARLCQQPGFYYGTDDGPSPREVVEAGFGRVAIGHSELNGHQNWTGGIRQGYRAAAQILNLL